MDNEHKPPSSGSLQLAHEVAAGDGAPPMTEADIVALAHVMDTGGGAVRLTDEEHDERAITTGAVFGAALAPTHGAEGVGHSGNPSDPVTPQNAGGLALPDSAPLQLPPLKG